MKNIVTNEIIAKIQFSRGKFTLDADIKLPAHGVTAIIGPSGSGKTTLLRAIAGLENCPNAILKFGNKIWQDKDIFVPPHKRSLAYVFQEASLFEHLNVQKNLEYGLKRIPLNEQKISLDKAIKLLGIEHLLQRRPRKLSGGERQRVAIARALAVSPEILLMDEPLAALDLARKREIMPYLESLHDELGIPIIYVSHSHHEVTSIADHLVLLEDGKVKASGAINEILNRLDLALAHKDNAGALIDATVIGHDKEFDLTYLSFPGGQFTVPKKDLPLASPVRLRIRARDVSITLEHQTNTSMLNIFPAIIDEISVHSSAQNTVKLLIESVPILARVTRKSTAILDLSVGKKVYVQAKTVALLI